MASFESIGFIANITYKQNFVILSVDEYHNGYKKSDGTSVDDKYVTYKVLFKEYFKKYISTHFSEGMLVKVKGEVLPYAIEHGKPVDGITLIGETCNLFSYPRSGARQEKKMMKESQIHGNGVPDLDAYNEPDF